MNEWFRFQMQCWWLSSRTLGSAEFHTDLTTTHIWPDCVTWVNEIYKMKQETGWCYEAWWGRKTSGKLTDRRNYTKTDIRTQIYRITPLPRPKGWPPTELCFLSPFLVIQFITNCVKLYGIVTPTVPPISFPCNTFSAPPRTPMIVGI